MNRNNTEAAVIATVICLIFLLLVFGFGHAMGASSTIGDCKTMGSFRVGGEVFECRKK